MLRNIIAILAERARTKKAIRMLAKQRWSVEFLVWLCKEAADQQGKNVAFSIQNGQDTLVIHAGVSADKVLQTTKEVEKMNEQERLDAMLDAASAMGVV